MSEETRSNRNESNRATWIGLLIALFGLMVIREGIRRVFPELTTGVVAFREALNFASAAGLLFLVRCREKLPLSSIGLGTSKFWKSAVWGLVTAVLCGGVAVVLAHFTHYGSGPTSTAFNRLPLWLVTVVVFRAGIVEELFYRGYSIERLQMLGLARPWAAAVPLLIFSLGHFPSGPANLLIALMLGGILTAFYLWRRDLVTNMLAHTLVDFVANVLPRLIPG